MQRTSAKIAAHGVFTALLLALTGTGCTEEEAIPSVTVTIEKRDLRYDGVYHAELKAKESVAVHVPKVADAWQLTVDSVLPDGSRVEEGDVILTFVKETLELDLRDEQDKFEVAEAERRKVAQALERERVELQLELDRRKLALQRAELAVVEGVNFISEVELNKAKLDVDKAKLDLKLAKDALKAFNKKRATALRVEDLKTEAAERAVDLKKEGLESVEVLAPIGGVLYAPYTRLNWQRTKVEPGVVARPGDKVLEIPDLSAYVAEVYVRPRDATLINEGDSATVFPTIMPQRGITAKVIEKEDFATTRNERMGSEDAAGNIKEHAVKIELDEAPEELRPGNTARVELSSIVAEDVVIVPLVAVQQREDESQYVTLEDGSERPVKLGRSTMTHAEVLEGLEAGQRVQLTAGAPKFQGGQTNGSQGPPGEQRGRRKKGGR